VVRLDGFDVRRLKDSESNEMENLANVSETSVINAPFNSSCSQFDEARPELFEWPSDVVE
jgi:hypothetical protein